MRMHITIAAITLWPWPVFAQAPVAPAPIAPVVESPTAKPVTLLSGGQLPVCGGVQQVPPPASLPPTGSGPVVYTVVICFPKQGNVSLVEPQTYLYYMRSPD